MGDRLELCRRVLTEMGVRRVGNRYRHLAVALDVILELGDGPVWMHNDVYPRMIERVGGNAKSLEKSIRDSIDAWWRECSQPVRQEYFGGRESRPPVKEFLLCVADAVRGRMDT